MKIYTIYKAKNLINGKCYIGFDSCWPKRKNKHLYCNTNYIFHNAIQKYGKDAFVWEILYQSKERDHTLKVMEEFFIKENNSHYLNGHGYNMTYGGNGTFGYIHSLETKEKIGNSWKGKKHSEETKKKMSEARKKFIFTPEICEKISKSKLGVKRGKYKKTIEQRIR